MKERFEDRISSANSLFDVLSILKEKTMQDTHVATLAFVDSVDTSNSTYNIVTVQPFPLNKNQPSYKIQTYAFDKNYNFDIGSKVLVVFTDLNFISNVVGEATSPKVTLDENTHLMKYGIVLPLSHLGGGGGSADISIEEIGSGNAVTGVSLNNNKITFYKGSTFLTSADLPTIPTKTSQLTNDSGFTTQTDLDNYVTLNTAQTITGVKTFAARPQATSSVSVLEWIQSNVTATTIFPFIRTGIFKGDATTGKLTCILDGYFTESQSMGFCGYDSGGQLGQKNGLWSTETTTSNVSALTRTTIVQVIDFDGNTDKLYVNGTLIAQRSGTGPNNFATTSDYPIFVARSSSGYTYQPAKLRLYNFKMYDGDGSSSVTGLIVLRDFVPAIQANELGLFDKEHSTFYHNVGLGEFTASETVIETITVSLPLLFSDSVARVGITGEYSDLLNKPAIPTVGNGILTIQKNGTTVNTFNANSGSNVTVNITVPTATNDLTNDSGFITINDVPKEIFVCTYGTTTYAEVTQALSDGKIPLVLNNNVPYIYSGTWSQFYTFSRLYNINYTNAYSLYLNSTDNSWSMSGGVGLERTSNKVTAISSSSTNTQYPSAKCVYDNIENVREVAEGKSTNYVINSKSDITGTEDSITHNYSNVSAITNIDISKLKVGDNVYIKDTNVPDYWVSEVYIGSSSTVNLSILETVKPNIASISVNGVNIPPVNENVDITVPNQSQKYRHILRITRIYAGNYPGGTVLVTVDNDSSTAITTISDAITAIRTYAGGTGGDYYIQATGFYASSSSNSYNICGVYVTLSSIYGVYANAYGKNQVDMGGMGSGSGSFTVTDNVITL